jgi:hypothetical protein
VQPRAVDAIPLAAASLHPVVRRTIAVSPSCSNPQDHRVIEHVAL